MNNFDVDHRYATITDSEENTLGENDQQCGLIYYNETTWLLKYSCTFCDIIFEDINKFCNHLTMHVTQNTTNVSRITNADGNAEIVEKNDAVESIDQDDIVDDMIVEMLDDYVEDYTEKIITNTNIEQYTGMALHEEEIDYVDSDASNEADDETTISQSRVKKFNSEYIIKNYDYENLIDNMKKGNTSPVRKPLILRKGVILPNIKRKKASKVIQISSSINEANTSNVIALKNKENYYNNNLTQKIIGETVITLIPAGTQLRKSSSTTNLSTSSTQFNCSICKENFNNCESFQSHVNMQHTQHAQLPQTIEAEIFKCRICGRRYNDEMLLIRHIRRHTKPILERCVVCGKLTFRITQHMRMHRPCPRRLHTCKDCGKTFNFSSGLSQHRRRMHKSPNQLPIPKARTVLKSCTICGKMTVRLNRHMKVHKPTPVDCDICGKTFNFGTNLTQHKRRMHRKNGIKPIKNKKLHVNQQDLEINEAVQSIVQCNVQKNHLVDADSLLNVAERHEVTEFKEEEAKRVIVELLQNVNSSYSSMKTYRNG